MPEYRGKYIMEHNVTRQDRIISTIKDLLNRKRLVDFQISEIEARICKLESEYQSETKAYGNIYSGLSGYIGTSNHKVNVDKHSQGASSDKVSEHPFSCSFLSSQSGSTQSATHSLPKRISKTLK